MVQAPWLYQGQPFFLGYDEILKRGLYGFIYRIENTLTGREYIGKRSFHTNKKMRKRGTNRRRSRHCSDWEQYWGSCDELTADVIKIGHQNFKRHVLTFHHSSRALSYAEEEMLFKHDVLRTKTSTGEWKYYNATIRGAYFRNTWQ